MNSIKFSRAALLFFGILTISACGGGDSGTPEPTPQSPPEPSPATAPPTPSPAPEATPVQTPVSTPTPAPTIEATPTPLATPAPTAEPPLEADVSCTHFTEDHADVVSTNVETEPALFGNALAFTLNKGDQIIIDTQSLGIPSNPEGYTLSFWGRFNADSETSSNIFEIEMSRLHSLFRTAKNGTQDFWYALDARLDDSADGEIFEQGAWTNFTLKVSNTDGLQTFTNGRATLPYRLRKPQKISSVSDLIFNAKIESELSSIEISNITLCAGQRSAENIVATHVYEAHTIFSISQLKTALQDLQNHFNGSRELSAPAQKALVISLSETLPFLRENLELAQQAADLIASFDASRGEFFKLGNELKRSNVSAATWAVYLLQQGVFDYAFAPQVTPSEQRDFPETTFLSANDFPGPVSVSAPRISTKISVLARNLLPTAYHIYQDSKPIVRMSGLYAPAGETITLTLPQAVVGSGIEAHIGSHDEQHAYKSIKRFPRVQTRIPLKNQTVHIANPFGGSLLFSIPVGLDLGQVEIEVDGAVRAPHFFISDSDSTTQEEWLELRSAEAPWAQFSGRKFMFSIPSSMIRSIANPQPVVEAWDTAMDAYMEMFARPTERHRAEYFIADVHIPGGGFGPGYPAIFGGYEQGMSKASWDPFYLINAEYSHPENSDIFILLHEFGHGHYFPTLPGEHETNVNLPAVYIHDKLGNTLAGIENPIDSAMVLSIHQQFTRDQAAVNWMISRNFADNKKMGIEEQHPDLYDQLSYQSRGHAKYADFAALFAWDTLGEVYAPFSEKDLETGGVTRNISPYELIANASQAAGVNTLPLFHFWGTLIPSEQEEQLQAQYPASPEILARLQHYCHLISANLEEFIAHKDDVIDTVSDTWPDYYEIRAQEYDETTADKARDHMRMLINTYFPEEDSGC